MKKPLSARTAVLLIIGNLIVFTGLYIVGLALNELVTMIVFTVVFAGTSIGYVVYNRGFSRRGVTPDMLPPEWSEDKKIAFIADGKERIEKSKWMLTVIFPLVAIYGFELINLYVLPNFFKLFK